MDNIIILACNIDDLETFQKCSNFLLPHPKYSCSIVHTFDSNTLNTVFDKFSNKSISLLMDKIIYENELEDVTKEIEYYYSKGVKHIFYSDLAIYTILSKLGLNELGVYYNPTKITSIIEAKAYYDILKTPIYVTTKVKIEDIEKIANDIHLCYLLYGYRYLFYSKRKLITDFKDEYNVDIPSKHTLYDLKEATRDELLPVYEDENGTFIYTSKPVDNFSDISKMRSLSYAIINLNLVNGKKELLRRLDNE